MYKTPYKIGKRNTTIPAPHWEELDANYTITKPTVICLGGNGTKTPEHANYVCKIAQNLMGLKDKTTENEWPTSEDVDIIGISYGEEYSISSFGEVKPSGRNASLTKDDREAIVSQLFTPLIAKKGQRFTLEEALKNVSMLTFFSFCQGAAETKFLLNKLENQMLYFGYKLQECEQILGQVVSVSYAPSTPIENVTRFDIKSLRDFMFSYSHDYEVDSGRSYLSLNGNELIKDSSSSQRFNYSNGMSLYSDTLANNYPYLNEHRLSMIERNAENWVLKTETRDGTVYLGQNADEASQCAGYVLASSVAAGLQNQINNNFTPKPDINSLYEDCCKIINQPAQTDTTVLTLTPTYVSER